MNSATDVTQVAKAALEAAKAAGATATEQVAAAAVAASDVAKKQGANAEQAAEVAAAAVLCPHLPHKNLKTDLHFHIISHRWMIQIIQHISA